MAELHSSEFFGPLRDLWWNRDFLALLAKRLQWSAPLAVLDVGCGQGHWTQALAHVLPPGSRVLGIDREAEWIETAAKRSSALAALPVTFEYRVGDVLQLDVTEEAFDVVTCQTLLIHIHQPLEAIRSMLRALRPGGWLLCAEPNNLASAFFFDSTAWDAGMVTIAAGARLELVCEIGKARLGEGFNSAGELLPGWFAQLGLESLQVYLSDKAMSIFPPYDGEAMASAIASLREDELTDRVVWSRDKTLRYWRAGGGDDAEFDRLWQSMREARRQALEDVERGRWHTAGGSVMYIVAGRKA